MSGPAALPVPDISDRPPPVPMSLGTAAFSAMCFTLMAACWNEWADQANPRIWMLERVILATIGSGAAALLVGAMLRMVSIHWPFAETFIGAMAGQNLMRGSSVESCFLWTVLMAVMTALMHRLFGNRAGDRRAPGDRAAPE